MQHTPLIFSRKCELLISGVLLSVSKWSFGIMTDISLTLTITLICTKITTFYSLLQLQLRDRNFSEANAVDNLRLQRSSDVLVDFSFSLRK